jgi:hypothetical protein
MAIPAALSTLQPAIATTQRPIKRLRRLRLDV